MCQHTHKGSSKIRRERKAEIFEEIMNDNYKFNESYDLRIQEA